MTEADPLELFYAATREARRSDDWGGYVDAIERLLIEATRDACVAAGLEFSDAARPAELLARVLEVGPERMGVRSSTLRTTVTMALEGLREVAAYLESSADSARATGSLPAGGRYRDLMHLETCVSNDAIRVMRAAPRVARVRPDYLELVTPEPWRSAALAESVVDDNEDQLDDWWTAAHQPGEVDPSAWDFPPVTRHDDDPGWPDLLAIDDIESMAYSDRFRAAVESVRRDGDTHGWLRVPVVRGGESKDYWVLNAWGPTGGDLWGLSEERVAGRSVVLDGQGDVEPLFAPRVRQALADAAVEVEWVVVDEG